jgi:hypothetical protein
LMTSSTVHNIRIGDDARLAVWNLLTGEFMQEFMCRFNGAIGAICWISVEPNEASFAFGCADGSLHVYRQEKGSVSPPAHVPSDVDGIALYSRCLVSVAC